MFWERLRKAGLSYDVQLGVLGVLGILNALSTYNIFNLQWVYWDITPLYVKEHLHLACPGWDLDPLPLGALILQNC